MKRIVFWALSTLSATVLLFGYSTSTSGPLATSASSSVISGTTAGQSTPSTPSAPSTTPDATGAAPPTDSDDDSANGTTSGTTTVTGSVAQTRWGPVEVEVTLDGSTITDVSVLQYPHGNGRDTEINNVALPRLISETIDAQSADIDMVSGATYTSQGYLESLQSALDQAGV